MHLEQEKYCYQEVLCELQVMSTVFLAQSIHKKVRYSMYPSLLSNTQNKAILFPDKLITHTSTNEDGKQNCLNTSKGKKDDKENENFAHR